MKKQFVLGYIISIFFVLLSIFKGNYEFLLYATATIVLLGLIHYFDKTFNFNKWALWGFDVWMVLHIIGGLFIVNGKVMYNYIILPIIGEPYNILKYDQFVHVYCYFIISILVWDVVSKLGKDQKFAIAAFVTVMAASGIGGLNEIIEFTTTLFFDNNVGGYENTAIDIVANLLGAILAIPFFERE